MQKYVNNFMRSESASKAKASAKSARKTGQRHESQVSLGDQKALFACDGDSDDDDPSTQVMADHLF